jgi:SAM-dependent methyltransferase
MSDEDRWRRHEELHREVLAKDLEQNRVSASKVLSILFEYVTPGSVLDVGCGLGTWLSVAQAMGAREVAGVDGEWLDPQRLEIDPGLVRRVDLEKGLSCGRRFDLVICLEVAEHLHEPAAEQFVAGLVEHGDTILFSAGIPHQGGHHHVNEQFPDYWAAIFAKHDFLPLDLIRGRIWNDTAVHWWFRQNILLFAHRKVISANPKLRQAFEAGDGTHPLSIVLPEVYLSRVEAARAAARKNQKLLKLLSDGGKYMVEPGADGRITVRRLPDRKD